MEAWKPKESIIKAIIAWAESNNFKYVSIHEDFANGCIEKMIGKFKYHLKNQSAFVKEYGQSKN